MGRGGSSGSGRGGGRGLKSRLRARGPPSPPARAAAAWDLVARNVALTARPPRVIPAEQRTLTAAQVRQLWGSVRGTQWEPFLILTVTTGLRQGELLGLQWADLDLDAGTLQVRRQLGRDKTFGPPKGCRRRRLDLAALEVRALREHRARQDEQRHQWGAAHEDAGLVFATGRGRPLSWRDVIRDFKAILRKAGLAEMRFHDLRHTNATLMLELGIHPKVVQERLGHSQLGITLDTYSHVLPTMGREAIERLNRALGAGDGAAGAGPGAGGAGPEVAP